MIPLVIDLSLSIPHPYFHETKSNEKGDLDETIEIFQLEFYPIYNIHSSLFLSKDIFTKNDTN